jgi:hypothetical protein
MTRKDLYCASFAIMLTHLEDMDFLSIFEITHKFTYILNVAALLNKCYTMTRVI